MICADLETGHRASARDGAGGRGDRAVHRRRHLHRMRHSRFPLAGRHLDQEPADSVRRFPGQPGDARRILAAALRHGGAVRRRRSPAAAIGRWPASIAPAKCRRWSRRTSTICIKPRALRPNTSSNCTAIRPTLCASTAPSATNSPGCARGWKRANGCAPDCPDCGGYIKTATISFGQAMPEAAMRRARRTDAVMRSLPRRSAPRSWSGRRPDFRLLAKRNGARLVIINREPTDFDDIADLVVREDIGDGARTVHRRIDSRVSNNDFHRLCTLLRHCCIFFLSPGWSMLSSI